MRSTLPNTENLASPSGLPLDSFSGHEPQTTLGAHLYRVACAGFPVKGFPYSEIVTVSQSAMTGVAFFAKPNSEWGGFP